MGISTAFLYFIQTYLRLSPLGQITDLLKRAKKTGCYIAEMVFRHKMTQNLELREKQLGFILNYL